MRRSLFATKAAQVQKYNNTEHACMYCINCFFIDNVVRLLFYVNVCACHVYFTINVLTYLLYNSARPHGLELSAGRPPRTAGLRVL